MYVLTTYRGGDLGVGSETSGGEGVTGAGEASEGAAADFGASMGVGSAAGSGGGLKRTGKKTLFCGGGTQS